MHEVPDAHANTLSNAIIQKDWSTVVAILPTNRLEDHLETMQARKIELQSPRVGKYERPGSISFVESIIDLIDEELEHRRTAPMFEVI